MSSSEKELEEQLKEVGTELLNPPSSTDALLKALDKAECLLTNVEQSPTKSMRDALLPLMKALVSDKLMKHSDEDVKVTVTSCITEITRITAPDAPYDDEKMKVTFQLTLEAFRKLSHMSGRCYTKALSILDAVAKVRSCLVMLDLECDSLILEMIQSFLKIIRSNHPPAVFSAMEAIMTNVLDESEEISSDLLRSILVSVRKENQEAGSISWKLGERVMSNCATKLQPYLMGAIQSLGASLDDYAPVVVSICQNGTVNIDAGNHLENGKSEEKTMNSNEPTPVTERHTPNASIEENPQTDAASESLISNGIDAAAKNDNIIKASSRKSRKQSKQSKTTETEKPDSLDSVPKKRGRKPNSLMNPDEGYDHYWIGKGREKFRLSNRRKSNVEETNFSPVRRKVRKVSLPTEVEKESSHAEEKRTRSENEADNENMKKEEKAQASSRKSKDGKARKDKGTKFSSVSRGEKASLLTKVEGESSAHAEEKHIQSEDEVVNENMKKTEKKAQASSRKSKVGKSRKKKVPKFASVSPRLETASLSTEVEKESSAHAEEKCIRSEDEVVNKTMKTMEEKAPARSRKSKVVESEKDKTTLDPGCVVSEDTSDYKEKRSVHLVMKLRAKSTDGDESGADRKGVIVKSPDTNMDRNVHKSSTCEVKDSRSAKLNGDDYSEETVSSQEKATRKHAIVENEVIDVLSAGEELVGRRIKVWWPLDRKFYEGIIQSFDPVSYDDGDEELLNLKKQKYEIIGDEETGVPKFEASSDIPRKRKGKIKSESNKNEKTSLPAKRGRPRKKPQVESAKSTEKAADTSMLKKPVITDESMDDSGSIDNGSKGNDKKLIDLIENNRLRISLKSKLNAGRD
ncbi:Sister chromatid cohesion protein PDS5-like B-B [Cucurbita argyrosperma subsp. argyrosperma]|nr:Sister chromatid cohesion protein PDS5-like B-B [Cucurbita argyrosperma subsp. argyrosperma]